VPDETSSVPSDPVFRRRGLLSTILVSIFFSAFAGFLWIGRAHYAVVYLAFFAAWAIAIFLSVLAGLVSLDSELSWLVIAYADLITVAILLATAALVVAARGKGSRPRWFSGGWMILPAFLVFVATIAALALLVRIFIYQPFSHPSVSMVPTIMEGDFVAASKWTYGYSRHSFPFSAVPLSGRLMEAAPARGDVIVFKYPPKPTIDYLKRVIGLPGERVKLTGGLVHINGRPVGREYVGEIDDEALTDSPRPVAIYRETLPNGVSFETLDLKADGALDDMREFVVPEGSFFVLGDNRDNSADSRVWGAVPSENLVGRIERIYWNSRGLPFAERGQRLNRSN
jgi:signal peptidase I